MLSSIFSSGMVILFLKIAVGRARPILLFENGFYGVKFFSIEHDYMSFPSGHSQAICAAMASLFFIYPRYDFLYVLVALFLTLSRIFTTNHYLSDIIMGSYVAVVTTIAMKKYFEQSGESVRIYLKRDKDLVE
jgi:membrane-associated phospholipid phosphatase